MAPMKLKVLIRKHLLQIRQIAKEEGHHKQNAFVQLAAMQVSAVEAKNRAANVNWYEIQEKVFTRWCNDHLAERGRRMDNLKLDMKDGISLINLAEILIGKSIGKYNKHPRINMQKMENITVALEFFKTHGISMVNVGTMDIVDGNMRIILGLVWRLIMAFELKSDGDKTAGQELLEWVNTKIGPDFNVKNFGRAWNDGIIVCALTNAMMPGLIPGHAHMDPANALINASQGISLADKHLGVDMLIMPEEMVHPKVDQLSLMTYVAQFRTYEREMGAGGSGAGAKAKDRSDQHRCGAFGDGLIDVIVNEPASFDIMLPFDIDHENPILAVSCADGAGKPVAIAKGDADVQPTESLYPVTYTPTSCGTHTIVVKLNGEHIAGSPFTCEVSEGESMGGEGVIRVFYTASPSSMKVRQDIASLERFLLVKSVHLRADFEPWINVDVLDKPDREAIFKKAGTRELPILFIDDKCVGGWQDLEGLISAGKADSMLNMKNRQLVTQAEHEQRLGLQDDASYQKQGQMTHYCGECGNCKLKDNQFCTECRGESPCPFAGNAAFGQPMVTLVCGACFNANLDADGTCQKCQANQPISIDVLNKDAVVFDDVVYFCNLCGGLAFADDGQCAGCALGKRGNAVAISQRKMHDMFQQDLAVYRGNTAHDKRDFEASDLTADDLFRGAYEGDLDLVEAIVEAGIVDINSVDDSGVSALQLAVEHGNPGIVRYLVQHGAQLFEIDIDDFYIAAYDGNYKLVKSMVLAGIDVNVQDSDGKTALTIATEETNYGIAHYLLACGAKCTNVSVEDYFIAAYDGNLALLQSMINADIDVNVQDEEGNTALVLAAETENEEMVRALIQSGAVGAEEIVFRYIGQGELAPVRTLFKAGVPVDLIQNAGGETAGQVASTSGHANMIEFFDAVAKMRM